MDGSGAVVPLTTSDADSDIWILSLGNDPATARPFQATSADERMAEFSPDGHYLAYVSNLSGQDEVYVEPW